MNMMIDLAREWCRARKPPPEPPHGAVVLLCGSSSSGKSSAAHELLQLWPHAEYLAMDQEYTLGASSTRRTSKREKAAQVCARARSLAAGGKVVLVDEVDAGGVFRGDCEAALRSEGSGAPPPVVAVVLYAPLAALLQRTRQRNGSRNFGEERDVWRALMGWAAGVRAAPSVTDRSIDHVTREQLLGVLEEAKMLDERGQSRDRCERQCQTYEFVMTILGLDRFPEVWLEPRWMYDSVVVTSARTPREVAGLIAKAVQVTLESGQSVLSRPEPSPVSDRLLQLCETCQQPPLFALDAAAPGDPCPACLKLVAQELQVDYGT